MSPTPSTLFASPRASQSVDGLGAKLDSVVTSTVPDNVSEKPHGHAHDAVPPASSLRRYFLLFLFAMAQFMDVYSASAVIVAIPTIAKDLKMSASEATWMVNAYSLTLAAFLLAAGRIADISSAKWVFVGGFAWVGIISLGIGFVKDKVAMFVLRAVSGIGASLTIPSALNLIVHLFPDPQEQAFAISIFGSSGAIANVAGLILGGALLLANWTWIFYFVTLIVLPLALAAALLIPATPPIAASTTESRPPKMDYVGTFVLTAAIVLLIYGLTEGSGKGWTTASTLSTLIIGFCLFPLFFLWEYYMNPIDALVAPSTWSIQNFTLITVISLAPYFWWFAVQVSFSAIFQDTWGDSAITTAIRFLPSGVPAFFILIWLGKLPVKYFPLRWRLVSGAILAATGTLILSFARERNDYWRLVFPAFFIGSGGCAMVYVSSNVALVMSVDPKDSGVAGGVFNSVLQLGTTIGLAITTTIQTSFIEPGTTHPSHKGYQSGFLFTMSVMIVVALLALVLFRDPTSTQEDPERAISSGPTLVEPEATWVGPIQEKNAV